MSYVLVTMAAFSGTLAGTALAMIAPDELAPGRRFFRPFRLIGYAYSALGIALFLSRDSAAALALSASLVFMLGLPIGTAEALPHSQNNRVAVRALWFTMKRHIWILPVAWLPLLFAQA